MYCWTTRRRCLASVCVRARCCVCVYTTVRVRARCCVCVCSLLCVCVLAAPFHPTYHWTGLPDENFDKKAEKSQTLFAVLSFLCHKETFRLQDYQKNVFAITLRLTLAWHCARGWSSSLLILLWLFMVCEIAHFGYNSATVCILIHRQLSAPIWKSSPNNFYTYNQNPCSPSTWSN